MRRATLLILWLLATPLAAEPVAEVQAKLDAAAAVDPVTREAALRRVLLLHEAEAVVGQVLSAGPPRPDLAALVTPGAVAGRTALRDSAAADFAPFCEGREPGKCLLAEAEALLAEAPDVDWDAEREGAIGASGARREIAVLLARADEFDDALDVAKSIAEPDTRNRAVRDIIELLARDRQFERAINTVLDLEQITPISQAANEIIGRLISVGEREVASELLPRAVRFAMAIKDERRRGEALSFIGFIHLDLDEIDHAASLTEQIEDEVWRNALKRQVAVGFVERGDFASAERLADSVEHPFYQIEALLSFAVELAKAGELEESRRVASRLEDPSDRARVFADIGSALIEAKRDGAPEAFAEAEALARGIGHVEDQASALWSLAFSHARAGNFGEADALIAHLVKTDSNRSGASGTLVRIAQFMWDGGQVALATGYLSEAERLAVLGWEPEKGSDDKTDDRLRDIARLYAKVGRHSEAERVAAAIEDDTFQVFALGHLAVSVAQTGKGQLDAQGEVLRIAGVIGGIDGADYWRGDRLKDVAQALAVAGDLAGAEAVAEMIVEPVRRNEALGEVAIGLAETGQLVEALRIAERVEDPAWRAVALGAVAARL